MFEKRSNVKLSIADDAYGDDLLAAARDPPRSVDMTDCQPQRRPTQSFPKTAKCRTCTAQVPDDSS